MLKLLRARLEFDFDGERRRVVTAGGGPMVGAYPPEAYDVDEAAMAWEAMKVISSPAGRQPAPRLRRLRPRLAGSRRGGRGS